MKYLNTAIYILIGVAVLSALTLTFIDSSKSKPAENKDTSEVKSVVPEDIKTYIESKSDLIIVNKPEAGSVVSSPINLSGQARGQWFFEADAPVQLVDWDGRIIAESYISAEGDWMTTDFVSFVGELVFESPYSEGADDFMKRGSLIFQKSNPSGLPEHDDALEIPVRFAK